MIQEDKPRRFSKKKLRLRLPSHTTHGIIATLAILILLFSVPVGLQPAMITQAFAAIDNKKPLVLIERPAEGSSPYAGIIYVRGSSSDNSGGSGVGSVEVNLDGQPYKKANPKAAGDWSTWTASFSIGSSGSHTILAKATDRAGNRDWDAVNFTIRSDTTDPIVAITAPLDGGTVVVSSTAKLTVKGKASDAGSGIGAVHIRLDKQSYIPVIPASTNDWSTWSATYSSVAAGAHTFTVRATDKAGNQEWDTSSVTVQQGSTSPPPSDSYPIPLGFTRIGEFSDGSDWEFWGRYTTNYASGGSGPSQRWDNEKMNKLNMVAGYDFRIGPTSGSRNTSDMVDLKFPRCVSDGGERGSYDLGIRWYDSGANSIGQAGKEMPHPATRIDDFNKNDPRPHIGNIKDGAWHSMLSVIYNDPLNGNAVTMKTWYNPTASGMIEDYIYLGSSVDSGNMPSGGEGGERILRYDCDPTTGGTHPLQIRIDEIPQGSLYVRNMFAAEVVPPR